MMFAIGHFALGYLTGKGSAKALKTSLNVPLLLAVSVLPDVDLFLQQVDSNLFMHRGATHSIVVFTVLLIPFFIVYGKRALPYYVALLSHALMGDLFTGGVELFWPISQNWYGNLLIPVGSVADVVAEFGLFAVATSIMYKTGELQALLKPRKSNLALVVAFGAVFGPILSSILGLDGKFPVLLMLPSVFWLVVFAYSVIIELWAKPERVGKN